MFIICFVTTKERVQPIKEENLNIARDVKILFSNDQWRILSIYNFMMLVAVVIRGGAVVYYVNTVLNKGLTSSRSLCWAGCWPRCLVRFWRSRSVPVLQG